MIKIAVVDKDDNVIGSEDSEVVAKKGLIHRIVRIILHNSKGMYYLQKRGPNKSTFPNKWDQSVGGHVDEGEDYLTAALREMKEELGIIGINIKEVVKFYQDNEKKIILKRFNKLYEAVYDGEIKVEEGESSGGGWYTEEKIKEWMLTKPDDFTPGCLVTFEKYWKYKNKRNN